MPALPLKSMSIEKLFQLQSQVETALTAKVAEERREIEAKLESAFSPRRWSCPPWSSTRRASRDCRCPEVSQSRKSERDLGGSRAEAALADGRNEKRQDT